MACGGCGGKKAAPSTNANGGNVGMNPRFNQMPMAAIAATRDENMVLIEYVGRTGGPMIYKGPVTGTQYRFGTQTNHKVKYVHKSDAEVLLQRTDFILSRVRGDAALQAQVTGA
jgi:hypothetical protein